MSPATSSVERRGVVERDRVDVEVGIAASADHRTRVGDDVEVAQAEEVHLQQAERLDAVHLVLRDDRCVVGSWPDSGLRWIGR